LWMNLLPNFFENHADISYVIILGLCMHGLCKMSKMDHRRRRPHVPHSLHCQAPWSPHRQCLGQPDLHHCLQCLSQWGQAYLWCR
jgi:hypothetical protein